MTNGSPADNHVVVIGAGIMGSGIAAHMANIGWQVSLLDIVPSDGDDRLAVVNGLWDRAKKARPPHFYLPETAGKVRLGNIEDNLDWVREADWVVEAVVEKMDIKKALYARLEPLLRDDTLITTNTSGLRIEELAEGRGESFRSRFVGTHFFNPPRYLKLLEIIPTSATDPAVLKRVIKEGQDVWAKRVVLARDTPGFIANRIGMFTMVQAVHAALETGLTIEEVDAITGPLIGRPKTGSFRLNDLVGLDIMQDVAGNQYRRLTHDKYRDTLQLPEVMMEMLRRGWLGNKSGQGFYRREGKEFFALDLQKLDYRPSVQPEIEGLKELSKMPWPDRLNKLLLRQDPVSSFLRSHLLSTLTYALYVTPEISDALVGVDEVMRWGFGWEKGPFETVDEIGIKPFIDFVAAQGLELPDLAAQLHDAGQDRFYHKEGGRTSYFDVPTKSPKEMAPDPRYIVLADIRASGKTVGGNDDASILDLGDGIHCVEFHTKMNALNQNVLQIIVEGVDRAEKAGKGLVIANDGPAFCAGFDLRLFLELSEAGDWPRLEGILRDLQGAMSRMRYAKVPVVAAVHSYALGGGCEIPMHCAIALVAPESSLGLPEVTVGVIPAAGGTATMTMRFPGIGVRLEAFKLILTGKVSSNADEARQFGYLTRVDRTVYNADQRIAIAKHLARGPLATRPGNAVPGMYLEFNDQVRRYLDEGVAAGTLTEYDCVMGRALLAVMSSPSELMTEEEMHEREREQFLAVVHNQQSRDRMRAMLETGKALHN